MIDYTRVVIVPIDNTVLVDNYVMDFDYSDMIDAGIWAVEWLNSEGKGHVEYKDPARGHDQLTSFEQFQPILDAYFEIATELDLLELVKIPPAPPKSKTWLKREDIKRKKAQKTGQ